MGRFRSLQVIAIVLGFCWHSQSPALHSACMPEDSPSANTFRIEIRGKKLHGKVSILFERTVPIRFPASGQDVLLQEDIDCEGFIPNTLVVVKIEILDIKGLPKGVIWNTSSTNNRFQGGSAGCLFFGGVPLQRGRFNVMVDARGTGEILGAFRQSRICTMRFVAVVE